MLEMYTQINVYKIIIEIEVQFSKEYTKEVLIL